MDIPAWYECGCNKYTRNYGCNKYTRNSSITYITSHENAGRRGYHYLVTNFSARGSEKLSHSYRLCLTLQNSLLGPQGRFNRQWACHGPCHHLLFTCPHTTCKNNKPPGTAVKPQHVITVWHSPPAVPMCIVTRAPNHQQIPVSNGQSFFMR